MSQWAHRSPCYHGCPSAIVNSALLLPRSVPEWTPNFIPLSTLRVWFSSLPCCLSPRSSAAGLVWTSLPQEAPPCAPRLGGGQLVPSAWQTFSCKTSLSFLLEAYCQSSGSGQGGHMTWPLTILLTTVIRVGTEGTTLRACGEQSPHRGKLSWEVKQRLRSKATIRTPGFSHAWSQPNPPCKLPEPAGPSFH